MVNQRDLVPVVPMRSDGRRQGDVDAMHTIQPPAVRVADERVDTRPLTEQLGSADELTTLSPTACCHQLTKIHSLPALRNFLNESSETLFRRELI